MQNLRCLKVLAALLVLICCVATSSHEAFAVQCTDYKGEAGHPVTIVNSSGEAVVVGVWGTEFTYNDFPAGITVAPLDGAVQLSFNRGRVSKDRTFDLYWGTDSSAMTNKIADIFGQTGTSYRHTSLTNGTTYYYQLKVMQADGKPVTENDGTPTVSNLLAATPMADQPASNYQAGSPAKIAAPTAVSAVAVTKLAPEKRTITLTWSMPTVQLPTVFDPAVTPSQKPAISSYTIYWSNSPFTDTGGANRITVPAGSGTAGPVTYIFTTIDSAKLDPKSDNYKPNYYYRITAISSTDASGNPLRTASGTLLNFESPVSSLVMVGVPKEPSNGMNDKEDKLGNPFKGYYSDTNWKVAANGRLNWCAPKHFNGRIFARTGCDADGQCATANCCLPGTKCIKNECTQGPEAASVVEPFFDSMSGIYYDVSFVDAYNFGFTVAPSRQVGDNCKSTGCKVPPACPWGVIINGVCVAPMNKLKAEYVDYEYRQEYITLSAMCADRTAGICGCGNQCAGTLSVCPTKVTPTNPFTKKTVDLFSSGCSPLNNYTIPARDEKALEQITCDIFSADQKTTKIDPKCVDTDANKCERVNCRSWPMYYRSYVTSIRDACGADGGAYSWQYNDQDGLRSCDNVPSTEESLGLTITIFPSLPNDITTPRATRITFNPANGLKGRLVQTYKEQVKETNFYGPAETYVDLQDTAKILFSLDCGEAGAMTCNFTYQIGTGFVQDPKAQDPFYCKAYGQGQTTYNWGAKSIPLGAPASQFCKSDSAIKPLIAATPGVKGHLCVGPVGSPATLTEFGATDAAVFVSIKDKEQVVLVENCGPSGIRKCSATLDMTKGLLPDKNYAPGYKCEDGSIDWVGAFKNNRLGLGSPSGACIKGTYQKTCTQTFTTQDARDGLKVHTRLPVSPIDPLKLDHDKDGDVDMIDSIMMLRRSMGL